MGILDYVATTPPAAAPTGEEILGNVRRAVAQLRPPRVVPDSLVAPGTLYVLEPDGDLCPERSIICHPDDAARVERALAGCTFPLRPAPTIRMDGA